MVQIIAWPNFGEPGKARRVEPSRLVQAQLVLDGEPFFDRPALKSMVERQVTTLGMQPIALAIGVIVAGYVECAQRVAAGDMCGAFNTLFTMESAEDRLMELVPKGSDQGPWASVVLLAGQYNQLATGDTFEAAHKADLVKSLTDDLKAIGTARARVKRDDGGDVMERRRREIRLETLDRVEKDVRLLLAATEELEPATWQKETVSSSRSESKSDAGGCYIATAVYGSYDSPSVLVLRHWRDRCLSRSAPGRAFIDAYYAVSPRLARSVGSSRWLSRSIRFALDRFVNVLSDRGYEG
ncbi:CFI-box-CTERM domain-containing protein [Nocardioides kribbensis]|uniref:CFI-box-CTERM domain-containing protein n=1 Tax=Nocardioides kribbensis TaxID=305517 RepID=A0ABV1NTJ9_9ACTN